MVVLAGVNLRPHLRGNAGVGRRFADTARLVDRPTERLLAVKVFAFCQHVGCNHAMRVIGRCNEHGIDITSHVEDPKSASSYVGPALEILSGLLTDTAREMLAEAFVEHPQGKETND